LIWIKISEIKPEMRNFNTKGKIISIGEVKKVETRFGPANVAQAILQDETGSITLNLWRDQIDILGIGDTIRVENAFVKTFKDTMELNVGRDGKITVLRGHKE
jgi:replication factor A1